MYPVSPFVPQQVRFTATWRFHIPGKLFETLVAISYQKIFMYKITSKILIVNKMLLSVETQGCMRSKQHST